MKKMRIAKYYRVSQADRDLNEKSGKKESESISHQRNLIEDYIGNSEDLAVCEQEEFYDDGFTGTNFNRPGFERMIEKIRNGEITCVIVKDFSRLGRDYIETSKYMDRFFPITGVRFISINDHYDSGNIYGANVSLELAVKNIVNDFYSRDLSVKVKTAKFAKMKQGVLVNGMVPYGYQKDPKDHGRMIRDPETAKVVREIFDRFLSGMRPNHIAVLLNDRGYDTPASYYKRKHLKQGLFMNISKMSCWDGTMIKRILQNRTYTGAVVSHTSEHFFLHSSKSTPIPEEEWIVVEGMHEAIVSKEEYERAQGKFRKTEHRVKINGNYPLFKKVRCGVCGRSCRYDVRNPRSDPHMVFFCSYARSQTGEIRCSQDVIREEELHRLIWDELQRMIGLVKTMEVDSMQKAELYEDLERIRKSSNAIEFTREVADIALEKVVFHDKDHVELKWKFSESFLKMIGFI